MKVLVAIPCYQCEPQIPRVLRQFTPALLERLTEVIVVDNHSGDKTAEVAVQTLQDLESQLDTSKFRVLRNVENYNLGGSFKIIVEYAWRGGFDFLVLLHGDDQARVVEIGELLDRLESNPTLDVIYGARFMKDSKLVNYSKVREWGNRAINLMFTLTTLRRVYEIGSGLNLYRVSTLPQEMVHSFPDHLAFDVDLLLNTIEQKMNIEFHPITWLEEDQVSNARNVRVGLDVLSILLNWRIGRKRAYKVEPRHREYRLLYPLSSET